ncbi:MAG: hypothetical protein KGZ25_14600 [Planctomycetes bacterium]|nr:hypothetical protein [Planctomycetota bacterium]
MSSLSVGENQNLVTVTTGKTKLELSKANGCILAIKDAESGPALCSVTQQPEKARLFRIIAMRHGQRARIARAHEQNKIEWEQLPDSVTFRYTALNFEGQRAECSATVRIEPGDDGELLFFLSVENWAEEPIHEIQFPMLPGWHNAEDDDPIELIAGAKWRSHIGKLPHYGPPAYCQWYQQVSVDYPGPSMYAPWLDFDAGNLGLAMTNYMRRPFTGGIAGINLAGHEKGNLECYWWRHYPLIEKGGNWQSPPVGIRVRNGDWHETADRYYRWFTSNVGVSLEQPESLRNSIGFQNIFLRNFDGTPENDFSTLPEHARVGTQYGIPHLCVWDSLSLGNYAIYEPDVDLFDYPPEEKNALQTAIKNAKKEGAITSALVNFRHINVKSDLYENYRSEAVLCLDGSEQRENWCGCVGTSALFTKHFGGNCILLSPRSPATQQRIDELLDKYIDLGYTAIFYDQPFLYQLDYNNMGDENRPDDASKAWYDVVESVRSRLRKRDPDAYVIGEQFDIFSASRAIDLHMEWNFTNSGIDDLARTLYSCPHALLSYVIDYTTSGKAEASQAFAAGVLLCITIDGGEANIGKRPDLAEHISRLSDLRKQCAGRMARGRFRHTLGLQSENDPGIVAYAYDSSAGPLVALAAGTEGGKACLNIDLSLFQTPPDREKNKLLLMNGESLDVENPNQLQYELAPNEVALWYC